jgi:Holliday junction resolvase RusA-like endonuclease
MIKTKIKPLSVNEAWKGRRFKTLKYKKFILDTLYILPKKSEVKIPKGNFKLNIIWGLSNISADIDNPLKTFIDVLQEKYEFNDSRITKLEVEKTKVKKGEEFIKWEIIK